MPAFGSCRRGLNEKSYRREKHANLSRTRSLRFQRVTLRSRTLAGMNQIRPRRIRLMLPPRTVSVSVATNTWTVIVALEDIKVSKKHCVFGQVKSPSGVQVGRKITYVSWNLLLSFSQPYFQSLQIRRYITILERLRSAPYSPHLPLVQIRCRVRLRLANFKLCSFGGVLHTFTFTSIAGESVQTRQKTARFPFFSKSSRWIEWTLELFHPWYSLFDLGHLNVLDPFPSCLYSKGLFQRCYQH